MRGYTYRVDFGTHEETVWALTSHDAIVLACAASIKNGKHCRVMGSKPEPVPDPGWRILYYSAEDAEANAE